MAKRTRTVHIFDGWADVAEYDGGFTILGTNDRWTTLSPKKPKGWDSLPVSKLLGVPVFDMWFDEEEGVVALLHQHGMVVGVFTLPVQRPNAFGAKDLADALVIQDVITKAQAKTLKQEAAVPRTFAKWTMNHGLEALLGLPEPKKKAAAKPAKKAAKAPAKKKAAAKPKKKAKAAPRKVR